MTPPIGTPVIKCAMCNRGMFDEHGPISPMPKITPAPLSLDRPTLRAILAGMALTGFIADSENMNNRYENATSAVNAADALLSELDRTQEPRT